MRVPDVMFATAYTTAYGSDMSAETFATVTKRHRHPTMGHCRPFCPFLLVSVSEGRRDTRKDLPVYLLRGVDEARYCA